MSEDRLTISIDDVRSALGLLEGFFEQTDVVIKAQINREAAQWEAEGFTSAAEYAEGIVSDIVAKLSDLYINFDNLQGELAAAMDEQEETEQGLRG